MSKKKAAGGEPEESKIYSAIKRILASEPGKKFSYKQLKKKLQEHFDKDEIWKAIDKLTSDGILDNRGKHFRLNKKAGVDIPVDKNAGSDTLTGKLEVTASGLGFVIIPGKEVDIKIQRNHLGNSMHGDEVKVVLLQSKKAKRLEGKVVEVIARGNDSFLGTLEVQPRFAFLTPDKNVGVDFFIPHQKLNGGKDGDKVIVKMISWDEGEKNPTAEVTKVLGKAGNNDVEMSAILVNSGFRLEFPAEVLKESADIPEKITKEEIAKRRDFRDIFTITIDPDDAKDFDDAVSLRKLENGNWEVGVHIADVSHYVHPGTALDIEAQYRATSVYLVDRVIPMFPEKISNEVCSLRPREEKLTYSAVFEMDEQAKIHSQWFGRTVIFSDHRFTYGGAQELIEGKEGEFSAEIKILNGLATQLRKQRFKNGSINFETTEVKFVLDENAKPIGLFVKERKEAHMLIEDFMLLANKKVAEYVSAQKIQGKPVPMVYRVHDTPDPEKLDTFAEFAALFGHQLNFSTPKHISASLNKLIEEIKGKPEQNALESLAIRTMAKAVYQTDNIGHYGLAFNHYTHFTSPIRRYPDILAHRILDMCLKKELHVSIKDLNAQCTHSSEMERKASEAERDSIKYKQIEFMAERIGEEFEGIITGVTQWGMYVEITETKCEGMVRLESIRGDYYIFEEKKMRVKGSDTGNVYKLGDKMRVKILRTNLEKRQIDLALIEEDN